MRTQNSTVVRRSMLLLALLSSATALAQKTASHSQRPRHDAAVPFIDNISPIAARVHGSGFILILDGAGFGPEAKINFQLGSTTHSLPTLVVNEGELAAYVPAGLLREEATASIRITNRHRSGEGIPSNPVLLPITKPTASVAFTATDITLGGGATLSGAIVTADFNADGQPDLAVSIPCDPTVGCFTDSPGKVAILLGRPDGTFFVAPSVAVNNLPRALATGDFNGDGKIDLAVADYGGEAVTILLNDGLGGFTPAHATVPVDRLPISITVGDFDRDGRLDLAVANSVAACVPAPVGCKTNAVSILLGRGDGTFIAGTPITGTGDTNDRVTTVDLNRDGILDLVLDVEATKPVLIYLGRGDGTFCEIAAPSTMAYQQPAAFGDVNRDGKLDMVSPAGIFPDFTQTILATALGNGNGLFHAGPASPVVNEDLVASGILADFNGDGKLDFAAPGFPDEHYDFFLGNGHGVFNLASSTAISTEFAGGVVVGDFNGDGKLDLAAPSGPFNGGAVSILLQQ